MKTAWYSIQRNVVFQKSREISKLTTSTQRKKLLNSFINAQFTYCPFIWMFSSKECCKRIIKITRGHSG